MGQFHSTTQDRTECSVLFLFQLFFVLEEFHGCSSLFQTGIISPSKLRMKLMGPHHHKKKDGSNSNSSRSSPSKLEDSEFVRNSLLATESGNFDEEGLCSVSHSLSFPLWPFHLISVPFSAKL